LPNFTDMDIENNESREALYRDLEEVKTAFKNKKTLLLFKLLTLALFILFLLIRLILELKDFLIQPKSTIEAIFVEQFLLVFAIGVIVSFVAFLQHFEKEITKSKIRRVSEIQEIIQLNNLIDNDLNEEIMDLLEEQLSNPYYKFPAFNINMFTLPINTNPEVAVNPNETQEVPIENELGEEGGQILNLTNAPPQGQIVI